LLLLVLEALLELRILLLELLLRRGERLVELRVVQLQLEPLLAIELRQDLLGQRRALRQSAAADRLAPSIRLPSQE
jgi:hypothetical protein